MPKDNSSNSTSWGNVSGWYDDLLSNDKDSYQTKVILPNVLRILAPMAGDKILDLACGNGFFSHEFASAGADVLGVDISRELVEIAKKKAGVSSQNDIKNKLKFEVSGAEKFVEKLAIQPESFNKIAIILAIQNIEDVKKTLENCFKTLKPAGKLLIVMNHPAFRIPKATAWGWDEKEKKQYRRLDAYLSESREEIDMAPGASAGAFLSSTKNFTISFHRPLQYYFKLFHKAGFVVGRLEEWTSHKKSEPGARQKEEDRIRKEIPMFLCLELTK